MNDHRILRLRNDFEIIEDRGDDPGSGLRVLKMGALGLPDRTVLQAIDSHNRRHVLIPWTLEADPTVDERSAGVKVTTMSLGTDGTSSLYLDLRCDAPRLVDVFTLYVDEVIQAAHDAPDAIDRVAVTTLARWRQLFKSAASETPAKTRVVGLLGELALLRDVVALRPAAIDAWQGPRGALHDIRSAHAALEVKASSNRDGWSCRVHDVRQLEPPGVPLFLALIKIEDDPEGISLIDVVDEIIELGAPAHRLVELLESAGISAAQHGAVQTMRFRIGERRIWRVSGGFPGITTGSFVGGKTPPGVTDIDFGLDLTSQTTAMLDEPEISGMNALLAEVSA